MDALRMVPQVRELGEEFTSTDTHYAIKYVSEDGLLTSWHIYGPGAPGTKYSDAANGSLYTDTTNYKLYIKTGAATWAVVGAQS